MKQIRIGNQTSFSADTPSKPFEYAIANGFDAFEWFIDKKPGNGGWDDDDIDTKMRALIKSKAAEAGIALSVHAPWHANPLKDHGITLLMKNIAFADEIGAGLLNMHLYMDNGINNYLEAITPIIEKTAKLGIKLSIENTVYTNSEDFNKLFTVLQKSSRPKNIGMCLDLGHANLSAESRNDYLKFVDRLEPHVPIIHVHMHENYGDGDTHLPIFAGPAGESDSGVREFLMWLKRSKFTGSIILEQWPNPPSLLNQARDRLYCIWEEK